MAAMRRSFFVPGRTTARTSIPSPRSMRTRWEPMKPAAPVTATMPGAGRPVFSDAVTTDAENAERRRQSADCPAHSGFFAFCVLPSAFYSAGSHDDELGKREQAVLRWAGGQKRQRLAGLPRITACHIERVINRPVAMQQPANFFHPPVARRTRQQAGEPGAVVWRRFTQRPDHRQGDRAALDVAIDRFAESILPAGQIQRVIGDLKRHSPLQAEGPQALGGGWIAGHKTSGPAGRRKQVGGFARNDLKVDALVLVRLLPVLDLHDFI